MYIDYLSNSRTNGMNTGREYLTMEELAAIIKREFDSSRLEKVRDLYLFACYTGLVYQDIKNLQPYNIVTAKVERADWKLRFRSKPHCEAISFK